MSLQSKNRLLTTSLALASAGILTCVTAVLNAFVPRGSTAAFIALLAVSALAVAATVAGFAWTCDKLERRLQPKGEKLSLCEPRTPRMVVDARGQRFVVSIEPVPLNKTPATSRPLPDYPLSLRGIIPSAAFPRSRAWHGQ